MILAKHLEELNKWFHAIHTDRDSTSIQILKQIKESLGLIFIPEKADAGNVCMINSPEVRDDYKETFTRIDLLDYIYAVLHSSSYRKKYKEFLKIDFSQVSYSSPPQSFPAGREQALIWFWKWVRLGGELRQLHLLASPKVKDYMTTYPKDGSNKITTQIGKKDWHLFDTENQLGRIWINDTQYFDTIPQDSWECYIGSYQPAQKWLNDRRGCTLGFADILHYQKIIFAVAETHRLIQEIDRFEF